ncbi:MAG: PrsW family intramembrane metalloprotease [Haloarculaceae archaeon]
MGGFVDWLRVRVRNTARIARWETTKNAGDVDRRTVAVVALALVGLAVVGPLAVSQGLALDRGIYRVGVVAEDPYYQPAYRDPTFRVQEPSRRAVTAGEQEVLVSGAQVRDYAETKKGRAAVSELHSTVKRYNDWLMKGEENRSAAFPVVVNLTYAEQDAARVIAPGGGGGTQLAGSEGEGTNGGSDGGGASDGGADGSAGGDGSAGAGADGQSGDGPDGPSSGSDSASGGGGGNIGGSSFTARLTGGSVSGSPSDIAPPFPFRSLVLAFVFILPLNFVIQAYGSTVLSERINRRGELLLVAPVSRGDIIVGKTLPYFAGSLGVAVLISLALGGSYLSVLAVAPLALLFLSATFLGAMFARSFKELTFVTVTITVSLTSYAFVPAIFTDVTPIALISPLTIVVRDLQGQAISAGQFAFSTLPPALTALVLFGLGAGLYREEDMFTQRPIPLKVLDALAGRIKRRRSVGFVTAILLPFVLVSELVVVALLFALGEISIPLVLVAVAVIEEVAKSLHVYAGYVHAKFDRRIRTALVLGGFSGLGFFLAEKLALIAQLVDLPDLAIGRAALNSQAALNTGLPPAVVLAALLVAPLVLHVVTASISAVGASRGKRQYVAALALAVAVHLAYNLTVVALYV